MTNNLAHPGFRIRAEVIPNELSVTSAAKVIGVGRPALSNLLNGKASLSPAMAAKIATAFNYSLESLMAMQAEFDSEGVKSAQVPSATASYVPPFLAIKANAIEQWVTRNIRARSRLAVFLRVLVHSTGRDLTSVDFPGNDDAERPEWDGQAAAREGSPWVPQGKSGWEFGTNEDPRTKADGDFAKSMKQLTAKERSGITFVFVTPRRWPGKSKWVKAAAAKGGWKEVRAYDASDLEQWLEQSLAAQAWFANETGIPATDVRSLDQCWADWANVSRPPLVGTLFESCVGTARKLLKARLAGDAGEPVRIAADSTAEALAFLAQALSQHSDSELAALRDRVLVFDRTEIFPKLSLGSHGFIAVAYDRETEREIARQSQVRAIYIYPRNTANVRPDIVLEPINFEVFNKSLSEMGKKRDEIERLSSASGRSVTVLRRRLASDAAIRTPLWAADSKIALSLIPFMLVGAWKSDSTADTAAVARLARGQSYEELEQAFQVLTTLDDMPVWSLGAVRGVVSKIDALFAVAAFVTASDLYKFFELALGVLGEDDPALDLDDDKRWAAALYGKTRQYSRTFREGISETLVLLSVHGADLFQQRLGIDIENEVNKVVGTLLPRPLTTRTLLANDRDLPTYAEAAPDVFLSALEQDLQCPEPAVFGLLRPAEGFFNSPSRSGLLWALEGLAWSPLTLRRASDVLARLSEVQISDNWANKPTNSLLSIVRAWMPQTAASHDQRVALVKQISAKFPSIGWQLCMAQIGDRFGVGHYAHKPRWRTDANGFGEPFSTYGPIVAFVSEMVNLALQWTPHSLQTLGDLVERTSALSPAHQSEVWKIVGGWAGTQATDAEKASLREKIRVSTMSRRAARRGRAEKADMRVDAAAAAAYSSLAPADLLNRHAWLFKQVWIEESAEELEDIEKFDHERRERWIRELRTKALMEILDERGTEGIVKLAEEGGAAWAIGILMGSMKLPQETLVSVLLTQLNEVSLSLERRVARRSLLGGVLQGAEEEVRRELLDASRVEMGEDQLVQLLVVAPFGRTTWSFVDNLKLPHQDVYWQDVLPDVILRDDSENLEAIERLLRAKRPRAAFALVQYHPEKLDGGVLYNLLSQVAKGGDEKPGQFQIEQHRVERAFKALDKSPEVSLEMKAGLEFAYLDALESHGGGRDNYGIPNLEKYVQDHPEVYVQAVVWAFRRDDENADPEEYQSPEDQKSVRAERGHKLLNEMRRLPGYDAQGVLDGNQLLSWIAAVRKHAGELARTDIADQFIGKLLSKAPIGGDGIWPCEVVRDVMEELQLEHVMIGAHTGVFNSRGAVWRGEGGEQERSLATKYLSWQTALQITHPFVARFLGELVKTYTRQAEEQDTEAGIRRRMR